MSSSFNRDALREVWRELSPSMKKALDGAADEPLRHQRHGWTSRLYGVHAPEDIQRLAIRGMLEIRRDVARITGYGGCVFGSVGEPLT